MRTYTDEELRAAKAAIIKLYPDFGYSSDSIARSYDLREAFTSDVNVSLMPTDTFEGVILTEDDVVELLITLRKAAKLPRMNKVS